MATISERLAYVLTFDTSSGVKSLEKFGKTADKELGKADQKLDKLGSNMSKFGAGAVAFAGLAGAGLVKMASGAADASANMSALEQVVGDVTAQEIGKWAEGSARAVGLASKEAVAASTQFAGLGKIIGLADKPLADFARSHVELAADMAAFKNVSPQQAVEDLSSAYAGSTEVLRKYNIFLDDRTLKEAYARETGEEVSGTLTTQQKIIAVNSELYRQGADMLGQFGRESGELSGQQAILRSEMTNLSDNIGAGVLPMLVSVLGVATDVTGALSSMSPEAQAAAGQFVALGVAGIGIIGTLSMIAGQVIKMRDRFTDSTGELNKFGKAAKGATVALAALAASQAAFAIVNDIRDVSGKAARSVEELNIAIAEAAKTGNDGAAVMAEFTDVLDQMHTELRLSNIWEDWGKEIKVAGDSGKKSIEDIDRAFNKVLQDSGPEAARALLDAWQTQTDALDHSGGQYRDNIELIERYTSRLDTTAASQDALAVITDGARVAVGNQANIMDDAAIAAGRLAAQLEEVTETEEAWQDWASATQEATDAAVDNYTEMVDAARNWADGIRTAVDSGSQSFNTISVDADTTAAEMTAALQLATYSAATWESNLATIQSKIVGGTAAQKAEFVGYIAEMGAAGAPMVAELAEGDPTEMFDSWVENSAVTGDGMIGGLDPVAGGMEEKMKHADGLLYKQMLLTKSRAQISARKIGDAIPDGVELGIEQGQADLDAVISGMVTSAMAAAKDEAGIESPSRLFRDEVGVPIVEGIEEGIVEEGDKIGDALERAIRSAESDAIQAAEALVDAASAALDGRWSAIDSGRNREDLVEGVADAEDALSKALKSNDVDKIADARERLEDANYRLLKATTDALQGTKAERDAWIETAKAAGLTKTEIDGLVKSYDALKVAGETASASKTAISAEAARATKIREDFAWAVRNGMVGKPELDAIGSYASDPAFQLEEMARRLNMIQSFMGAKITKYHQGGVVAGPLGSEQPAILQAGETVLTRQQAASMGTGGGSTFNVTINADPNPDVTVRKLREWVRRNGPIQGLT
jgi:hypothetical protein